MIPLQTQFNKYGYRYSQLWRNETHAIYSQADETERINYEVIEIVFKPKRILFGKSIEASECYPSSEKWGAKALTVTTLQIALEKAAEWARIGGEQNADNIPSNLADNLPTGIIPCLTKKTG